MFWTWGAVDRDLLLVVPPLGLGIFARQRHVANGRSIGLGAEHRTQVRPGWVVLLWPSLGGKLPNDVDDFGDDKVCEMDTIGLT